MSGPTPFRRIPLEFMAMQYELENRDALIAWLGDKCHHTVMDDTGCLDESLIIRIHTLEGQADLEPGAWAVQGVDGNFHPCADHIFRQTYICDPEVIPHTEYMRRTGELIAAILAHRRFTDHHTLQDLHLYHVVEESYRPMTVDGAALPRG